MKEDETRREDEITFSYLKGYKPVCILGNPNTGKSNLSVWLCMQSGIERRYVLGYPGKIAGFTNLNDLRDLSRISDCVLLVDEIDEIIPIHEKRSNDSLKRLLKFTAHNRIKLIFNTQLSQFVSKMMSALVPCWAFTEIDIFELKNGSKPKRILLDYLKKPEIINREVGMRLSVGSFIWYNDYGCAGENGVYGFPDMSIAKDWGNVNKKDRKQDVKDLGKSVDFARKNPE